MRVGVEGRRPSGGAAKTLEKAIKVLLALREITFIDASPDRKAAMNLAIAALREKVGQGKGEQP